MLPIYPRRFAARLLPAFALLFALVTAATAQRPEDVPGLEDLDSIPASSGYHTATGHIVYFDTLGARIDSSLGSRSRYDERGRIVEKIGYTGTDEEVYRQSWFYDETTGLVRRSRKQASDDDEPNADWWYSYDASGRLTHAEDSITKVAVDYHYDNRSAGAPCIAVVVSGRFRFSGIDSYCDTSGRIVRELGYIGGVDTVTAVHEYRDDRHVRTVYSDGDRRIRQWIYRADARGHQVGEEYRTGSPQKTEVLYTIDRLFENDLLRRVACRNYGMGDWVEYYEYR